jgi:hypothetical protein
MTPHARCPTSSVELRRLWTAAHRTAQMLGHKLYPFSRAGESECVHCGASVRVDAWTLEASGEAMRQMCQGGLMLHLRAARKYRDDGLKWRRTLRCALERWHLSGEGHDRFALEAMTEAYHALREIYKTEMDEELRSLMESAMAVLEVNE